MPKLEIYELPFEYGDWNIQNYKPSELNVSLSKVEFGIAITENPSFIGLKMRVTYGLDYYSKKVFSFTGEKQFSFLKSFLSVHFLSFLTEIGLREFHAEAILRKKNTPGFVNKFSAHSVDELMDNLLEVYTSLRSEVEKDSN